MSQAAREFGVEKEVERRKETGMVHSITSPLSIWRWIKNLAIHPAIFSAYAKEGDYVDTPPPVDPDHIVSASFLKIYPVDGYVPSTTHLIHADGEETVLRYNDMDQNRGLSLGGVLYLLSGLPNRMSDHKWQPVRNLIGGWNSLWPASTQFTFTLSGKRFWNVLALIIKIPVIFPLKIVGFFFKLALNVVKLVTEFLPELIVNYTAKEIGEVLRTIKGSGRRASKLSLQMAPGLVALNQNAAARFQSRNYPWGKMIATHVLGYLWLTILLPLHYAARLVGFVGEAMTSPEKSARDAWEFGARVRPRALGYVLGTLGAAFSVALTTTLWMIILPFAVSGILALFPQLTPVLAAIAQWPVVASSLNFIQGTFSLVAGSLPSVFSTIGSAMSAAVGISVSNLVLAVTVTAAVIAAPVLTIGSRIADELSNGWARWRAEMGFAQGMKAIFTPKSAYVSMESIEKLGTPLSGPALDESLEAERSQSPASRKAQRLGEDSEALLQKIHSLLDNMEQSKDYIVMRFEKLEKGYKAIEVDTQPQYV